MRKDLQQHLVVGAGIGLLTTLIVAYETSLPVAVGSGVVAAAVAGWAKEYIWDKSGKGVVDFKDFLYTAIGGVIGAGVAAAIRSFV
jgi:uncharacterized membrane protein YfcA